MDGERLEAERRQDERQGEAGAGGGWSHELTENIIAGREKY
jgi:hypothetical protein